jgi:phage terminase Nu1 subunit (DNA packaging protein)
MNRGRFLLRSDLRSLGSCSGSQLKNVGRKFTTLDPELLAEKQKQESLNKEREALVIEAGAMTRSLFRICLRSIRLMRKGNEHDEKRFSELEGKQIKDLEEGVLSASPPVNREDEMKSRADYYTDVARERIYRSAQCMDLNPLSDEDLHEYIHHLRQGEKHRRWVLAEYKFSDPCPNAFDYLRADAFEQRSKKYLLELEKQGEDWEYDEIYHEEDSGEEEDLEVTMFPPRRSD